MKNLNDFFEKARSELCWRRAFKEKENEISIAFLIRESDWKPLDSPWWTGKEVCIIGGDYNGNFLLRHCDGSVRFWNHETEISEIIAPSVKKFVSQIV